MSDDEIHLHPQEPASGCWGGGDGAETSVTLGQCFPAAVPRATVLHVYAHHYRFIRSCSVRSALTSRLNVAFSSRKSDSGDSQSYQLARNR